MSWQGEYWTVRLTNGEGHLELKHPCDVDWLEVAELLLPLAAKIGFGPGELPLHLTIS